MNNSEIPIGLHQGRVMMRLAKHYAELPAVIIEVVQNSIDSEAKRIEVRINTPGRTFSVLDNGIGASQEKVIQALQSIGQTLKDKHKYGQFGLGLISPISIANEFTLTSCPRGGVYTSYLFVASDIVKQKEVTIPSYPIENLRFDEAGPCWWRTRVEAKGITKDKRASGINAEQLATDIALKFGEEIHRRNIAITIDVVTADGGHKIAPVEVPEYAGEKLDVFQDESTECGKVMVELWVARLGKKGRSGDIGFGKKGRSGDIGFGNFDNPSRISCRQFVQCAGDWLDVNVGKALTRGILEGRIRCGKIILHADRTRFEKNDALFALCETLERWYKRVGKKVIELAEEKASDDRFQRIGSEVMPFAELLLRQEEFKDVTNSMVIGTTGKGHKTLPKKLVVGPDSGTSIAVQGKPFCKKDGGTEGGGGTPDPKTDHPEHTPGIVYGPRGRKRTEVKGNSTGLRFDYIEMGEVKIPFEYDPESGTLYFNLTNSNWGLCTPSDVFLREYHIAVVTTALSLELYRDANGQLNPELVRFAHSGLRHQVFAICNGKAMTGKS